MPIFEYICKDCDQRFEALILGARKPECPHCRGHNLEQQFSVFAAGASRSGAPAPAACASGST